MIGRRRNRENGSREARTIPVHRTALWRGALIEIQRLDAENKRLRTELARYEGRHEQRLDEKADWVSDGRPNYHEDDTEVLA